LQFELNILERRPAMQTSPYERHTPLAGDDGGRSDRRPSDMVYPAMTLLAMILLLGSMWAF
jgi:hypothetical protein